MRDLEARANWIDARIDELMDDDDFFKEWRTEHDYEPLEVFAKRTAEREHATIIADLEDERINQHRGHHEF